MTQIGEAAAAGAAVDMSNLLGTFMTQIGEAAVGMCRVVMGKSFRSEGRNKLLRELVGDTSPLLAGFNVEEFFPFLARFGVLSKMVRAKSVRLKRRWDDLLDNLIQDHERNSDDPEDKDADFIHVLLSVRHEYGPSTEQTKGILLVSTYSSKHNFNSQPIFCPGCDLSRFFECGVCRMYFSEEQGHRLRCWTSPSQSSCGDPI
jgi:hypothetical protein